MQVLRCPGSSLALRMMFMPAVRSMTMTEEMHQRTKCQQQIWQESQHMGSMFQRQKKSGHAEKSNQRHATRRSPEGPRVFRIHALALRELPTPRRRLNT